MDRQIATSLVLDSEVGGGVVYTPAVDTRDLTCVRLALGVLNASVTVDLGGRAAVGGPDELEFGHPADEHPDLGAKPDTRLYVRHRVRATWRLRAREVHERHQAGHRLCDPGVFRVQLVNGPVTRMRVRRPWCLPCLAMALSLVNGCDGEPDTSSLDGGGDAAGGRVGEAGRPDGSAADLGSAGGRGDASAGPDSGVACDIRGTWQLAFEPAGSGYPDLLTIQGEPGAETTNYFDGTQDDACICPSPIFAVDRSACSLQVTTWGSGLTDEVFECLVNKTTLSLTFSATALGLVGEGTIVERTGQMCEPSEGGMDWTVTALRVEEPQ